MEINELSIEVRNLNFILFVWIFTIGNVMFACASFALVHSFPLIHQMFNLNGVANISLFRMGLNMCLSIIKERMVFKSTK